MEKIDMEEKVIGMLKTVFDPEIPVNIYDLGLIYKIDIDDSFNVDVDMTLTAPNCPAADFMVEDVRQKLESIARSSANKAANQHRSVKLRPMTPYERRIVHIALRDDSRVETASEGEGSARHVVVLPVK